MEQLKDMFELVYTITVLSVVLIGFIVFLAFGCLSPHDVGAMSFNDPLYACCRHIAGFGLMGSTLGCIFAFGIRL